MSYLADCSPVEALKIMRIAQEVKELRQSHRFHKQGYSNDRAKSMRMIGRIPVWVMFDKRYAPYFDKTQDVHERRKNIYRFFKDHPEFVTVDNL